jgi:biotin carboxylase
MPGDRIDRLIDLAYDTNLVQMQLTALDAEGRSVPRVEARRAAAVTFLEVPPGRVVAVGGADDARAAPGVHEVAMDVSVGDEIGAPDSSWARPGYVVASGETVDDALRNSLHAAALLEIRTEASA